MKDTPLLRQYAGFKRQYPDKIVLFRMGDFFETFGDDAKITAKILNITLTKRNKNDDPTPLAGFPHHALEQYLPKIIKAGYCAVIVDQVEDPKQAKGLVKRAVTRVVTPGTLDTEEALKDKSQNIISLYSQKDEIGVAICDLYTGKFLATELLDNQSDLQNIINAYEPVEAILTEDEEKLNLGDMAIQLVESGTAKLKNAEKTIKDHFQVKNLESLGLSKHKLACLPIAMILEYIKDTQKLSPKHINKVKYFKQEGTMVLDRATIRNLELVESTSDNTLVKMMDECQTSMGRRLLRYWVLNPLIESEEIVKRLRCVDSFYEDYQNTLDFREVLENITDIEKITGKIGLNRVNARNYKALQYSLEECEKLCELIPEIKNSKAKKEIKDLLNELENLTEEISLTIREDPPNEITEGGIIAENHNDKVDELRSITGDTKTWLKDFEDEERESTGISSLKISSNKVFGYYIEVTKTHTDKVPDRYVRKQTLVNSERYITDELKKKEELIFEAEEKLQILEYELFQKFRESTLQYVEKLQKLSCQISKLDVLSNFAFIAINYNYVRPEIHPLGKKNGILKISNGRHPIVERAYESKPDTEPFVPNDTKLNTDDQRFALITGPNMSGKSTFIRQVATIVLMAQIGSYVPAEEAEISVVDRIFTRVGAHDDLSEGRSTFMVEMDEAANIINNATKNSLVILDEIGRGTSTYDGVSIAWAISEYLLNQVEARTLFATHYHELLKLEGELKGVKNLNVLVEENKDSDEVIFLRKIVKGGTDRSYGIYVAKLAGLPEEVIKRAKYILRDLEERNNDIEGLEATRVSGSGKNSEQVSKPKEQDELYEASLFNFKDHPVVDELRGLDVDTLTPVEALNKLNDLKKDVEGNVEKD